MANQEIKIGDTVRSFDFDSRDIDGIHACFIEGTVKAIGRLIPHQSCDVYEIECTKKVFGGEVRENHESEYFPPVNGTPKMFGGVCDHVEKI